MAKGEALYRKAPIWAQQLLLNGYAFLKERHSLGASGLEALERLRQHERWTPEQLRAYQDERVQAIVRHAYDHSRYHRATMDAARLKPSDIRGTSDLVKLPLLRRETVRERGPEIMTAPEPLREWRHGHTSGTTGSPLSVWYDRQTCIENNAQDRRQKSWGGMGLDDRIGMFLGRVIVPPTQRRPPYWRVNVVQRETWFSSFHMSETTLPSYVAELRRAGIRFLEGYPSTLFILATYLRRAGETLPMRAVFTSSETLHPIQRELIEQVFACRLFDFYGLAERVIFAGECEAHAGRHLAPDYGFTEVVDDAGQPVAPGQWGYLVGTSLHNTAMPMLRYRTNDVSRILVKPCACGRPFPVLDPVTTKAEDVLQLPDGRIISPSILTHPFKPYDQIMKSQVIQVARDRILVKLVAGPGFTREHQAGLIEGLEARLGAGVTISVEMVNEIPPERSGKFRWVISQVETPYSPQWDQL